MVKQSVQVAFFLSEMTEQAMQISEERVSQGRGRQSWEQESDAGEAGGRPRRWGARSWVADEGPALFSVRSEGGEQQRDGVRLTFQRGPSGCYVDNESGRGWPPRKLLG